MQLIKNLFKLEKAYAHCDIPCGIYDPHLAQVSAFTVLRMASLIKQLDKNAEDYDHKFSRYVTTKEEHAEQCKHEIRIIYGDYF
jgi:nickel superoxide dismutase